MKAARPAWHEFTANLNFNDTGLSAWFACQTAFNARDGASAPEREFTHDGQRWKAELSYSEGNLVPPQNGVTPAGTTIEHDTIREWRFHIWRHPDEDPLGNPDDPQDEKGQQKFHAHVRPRWQRMKGETKTGSLTSIPVPESLGEGVSVRVSGANIAPRDYYTLLRRAAAAFGINPRHFGGNPESDDYGPHETSSVQDAERYVRVHKRESGPIHARDGPLARMGHLLENDRSGYRKVVQQDDDHSGTNLPGFYHTVTLGPKRVTEAFPGHELAVETKHYYSREAANIDTGRAVAHPKLGASYQVSRMPSDHTLRYTDDDLTQLERELDRIVVSILAEAGLDVAPGKTGDDGEGGTGPFVEDAYFEVDVRERGPDPVRLDFARIRDEQESVVVRHLSDGGFSPVEWDIAETLVGDGGTVSPEDIADENDRPVESVRRALRRMDGFLERARESVAFESPYVAELVVDAVRDARDASQRALGAAAKAAEADRRGIEETASAFLAFCEKHGIDYENRTDARMKLRMGDIDSFDALRRRVQRTYDLWTDAGRDEAEIRDARLQYRYRGDQASASFWNFLRA